MSAPCTVCGGDGRSKIWGASAGLVEAALGESALVCARCKGTGSEPNHNGDQSANAEGGKE